MSLSGTPWVEKSFKTAWDRIAKHVPESWMPQREQRNPASRIEPKIIEFACGHYGCVMPTNEPGLVCKLTTDVSEAHFIRIAETIETSDRMSEELGMVQYKKIFKLEGLHYKGRPMFVLWRTEAYDVGLLMRFNAGMGYQIPAHAKQLKERYGYDEYHLRNIKAGEKLLGNFNTIARFARQVLVKRLKDKDAAEREDMLAQIWKAYENADDYMDEPHRAPKSLALGVSLRQCLTLAQEMGNTDVFYPIGTALSYYLEEGILLADVHMNNIGRDAPYEPGGNVPHLIITDPGHAAEFNPRWAQLPGVEVI